MIIKEALEKLEGSTHPVALPMHRGEHFRVLVIVFKKGMVLKEHKTSLPAKLTVLNGRVLYRCGTTEIVLTQYDETLIPVETIHSVDALDDSICLLTQG